MVVCCSSGGFRGEPCSIQCVLAMGTIPTLQCKKCLCLFHPECIGLHNYSMNINQYICEVSETLRNCSAHCFDEIFLSSVTTHRIAFTNRNQTQHQLSIRHAIPTKPIRTQLPSRQRWNDHYRHHNPTWWIPWTKWWKNIQQICIPNRQWSGRMTAKRTKALSTVWQLGYHPPPI